VLWFDCYYSTSKKKRRRVKIWKREIFLKDIVKSPKKKNFFNKGKIILGGVLNLDILNRMNSPCNFSFL
jgi:hypothetical protein